VLYYYFDTQRHRQLPAEPNFVDILQCIVHDEFMLPTLPVSLVVLGPNPGATITSLTPGQQVAPTPPEKPKGPTKEANLHPVTVLLKVIKPGTKLRDFKGDEEAPKNKNGVEKCLAFHLKGECYSNCAHKEDHHAYEAGTARLCKGAGARNQRMGQRIVHGNPRATISLISSPCSQETMPHNTNATFMTNE